MGGHSWPLTREWGEGEMGEREMAGKDSNLRRRSRQIYSPADGALTSAN